MKARLSFFYFAIFSFVGIHMPFWPVWLKSQGIDAMGIAVLTALSFALKIVVTPWVSRQADRSGRKREAIVWLALGLLLGCGAFFFTHGFTQIFVLTLLAFSCWSPIMSLAESVTTMAAKAHKLDYGRIRLWGSVAFALVAGSSGVLLQALGEGVLLWAICAAAAVLWVAACLLPRAGAGAGARPGAPKAAVGNGVFFRTPWFMAFLLATMLIQGSHAAYYTFGSIHWREAGLSDQAVGLLWGASLVAEVVFFAFGRPVVERLGAVNVIVLGGVCAALRWSVIGASVDPLWLGLAQLLHAFSFGASHFAAIRLISEHVDDSLSASGQGLYSAFIMGLGMGVFVLASGPLYGALGASAFYVMAGVALAGVATMAAARRLAMTRITPDAGPAAPATACAAPSPT